MSSVGVFRKMDLDEKSYLVYTSPQSDNPKVSTSFFCPAEDRGTGEICKSPLVPLFWCNTKQPIYDFHCYTCGAQMHSTSYYTCLKCEKQFHKECVASPHEIKHPSHPFHPLLLSHKKYKECICCGIDSSLLYHCTTCKLRMHPICATRMIPLVEDHPKSHPHPLSFFPTQASLVCHICGLINKLDPTYICVQCVFVIHKGCIGFPHLIRISRHHHRISFTPSLPPGKLLCRVCHKDIDNNYGAYSCRKCDDAYFVHTKCALNPKVWDGVDLDGVPEEDDNIDDGEPFQRIADGIILHPFHSHNLRLEILKAFDEKKFCRGCALPIYEGQFYSCLEMECDFILHEGCAQAPRMKRHPLHPYPVALNVATVGPDNKGGIFSCTVCERKGTGFYYEHRIGSTTFQLDLRCASVTEPFAYQGHQHPLFLPLDSAKESRCQTCTGFSSWKLKCYECDYIICFCCATFPYKARYKHDDHFLTIRDKKKASDEVEWCEICEGKVEEVDEGALYVKKFRGNREPLAGNIKSELRFYRCDECSMALHVECLLGIDMNMKPSGNTIEDCIYFNKFSFKKCGQVSIKVWIHLNSSLSRPICTGCDRRCEFPIVFKGEDNTAFCSWYCIGYDS